jgi:hypothetical protein
MLSLFKVFSLPQQEFLIVSQSILHINNLSIMSSKFITSLVVLFLPTFIQGQTTRAPTVQVGPYVGAKCTSVVSHIHNRQLSEVSIFFVQAAFYYDISSSMMWKLVKKIKVNQSMIVHRISILYGSSSNNITG